MAGGHPIAVGFPQLPALAVAGCILSALIYLLIQKAYPKPIPGIPYNRTSANRLVGDIPELGQFAATSGSFRLWFLEQARRHNSAITQVFLGPFEKAGVIISDYREVNDILSHRDAVDFKRGKKVEAFRGILPHAFPAMETFDPMFKSARNLARDLMTPSILHTVNAPRIHNVTCNLLELWRLKSRIASGRPFDVAEDVSEFSFDAILSAAMGLGPDGGDIKQRTTQLIAFERTRSIVHEGLQDIDGLVIFPDAERSAKYEALKVNEDTLWKAFAIPWPTLYHRINNLRPSVRGAARVLKGYIASQIATAVPKLTAEGGHPECALDYVIQREIRAAEKEGRPPVLDDPRILEPVYGYLIAGHDTSSGSLLWLLRRLLAHPGHQEKIRANLYETFADARREMRLPTAVELVRRAPYLDAFIEEVLRFNTPVVNIMVMTRMDTVVLGHHIPADTRVFLNLTGPSINKNSVGVEEKLRSDTSKAHKPQRENWDDMNPEEFRPERWLRRNGDGKLTFDSSLGPSLAFSAGNRGCWGKRLGYLELRIVFALLIWSFEFSAAPDHLVTWDTYDSLVTAPKQCLVRITEIKY